MLVDPARCEYQGLVIAVRFRHASYNVACSTYQLDYLTVLVDPALCEYQGLVIAAAVGGNASKSVFRSELMLMKVAKRCA